MKTYSGLKQSQGEMVLHKKEIANPLFEKEFVYKINDAEYIHGKNHS